MPKSLSVKEDQGAGGGITLEEIKIWGVFGNWWIFKISQHKQILGFDIKIQRIIIQYLMFHKFHFLNSYCWE